MHTKEHDKLIGAFQKSTPQNTEQIKETIWQHVLLKQKHSAQMKFWGFSLICLVSSIASIPALEALSTDLSTSGFYQYFSLLFSDTGNLALYWKELGLSLIESLPTLSIILALSVLFVFFISIKQAINQIIKNNLEFSF